jgi:KAP family P-loop domain/TIR domain/Trypsin-like peptidase domain
MVSGLGGADIVALDTRSPAIMGGTVNSSSDPTFGETLRWLRRRLALSQSRLASYLLVDPTMVSKLETGVRRPPTHPEFFSRLRGTPGVTDEDVKRLLDSVNVGLMLAVEPRELLDPLRMPPSARTLRPTKERKTGSTPDRPSPPPPSAIVSILDRDERVLGGGFLLSGDGIVVTAREVLGFDDDSTQQRAVMIAFPGAAQEKNSVAEKIYFTDDLAFVKLSMPPPGGVMPLRLASSGATEGHEWRSYVTPTRSGLVGYWLTGRVVGTEAVGGRSRLVLESNDLRVGFAGVPVIDVLSNRVIGMLSRSLIGEWMPMRATAIPAELIWEAWPQAELASKPTELQTRPLEVYAAYARRDEGIVESLRSRLRNDGIEVWMDEELIVPGPRWQASFSRWLGDIDVVLVFVSQLPDLEARQFRDALLEMQELGRVAPRPIHFIPVRLEECEVPWVLRAVVRVDLFQDDGYAVLLRGLQRIALEKTRLSGAPPFAAARTTTDSVPTQTDLPVGEMRADQLHRVPFARALALRVRGIRTQEARASFMLHIHGPWGSGKTSLLNFVSEALQRPEPHPTLDPRPWLVVRFNAWQYERLGSPWWWLLDAVSRQVTPELIRVAREGKSGGSLGLRGLALVLRLREFLWRFRTGPAPYAVTLTVVMSVALGLYVVLQRSSLGTGGAPVVAAILAVAVAVSSSAFAVSRWLLTGSRAAHLFMQSARDPMNTITRHLCDVAVRVRHPVVVCIDDVDRCQADYVVQLLEGIQTLFRDAPIAYLVAADRRWIRRCFEATFSEFVPELGEPGRSLGDLFLEKMFQLSISVPRMSAMDRQMYWRRLLGGGQGVNAVHEISSETVDAAERRVSELHSEEDFLSELEHSEFGSPYDSALRAAAVVRLATPEIEARTEHTLGRFGPLMEANPRSMKRLVNAYGVQRAAAILANVDIGREQLALWTIVELRFPPLAEYLEKNPSMVQKVLDSDSSVPGLIRDLCADEDVRAVITGEGVDGMLDEEAIRACLGLRTADDSSGSVA